MPEGLFHVDGLQTQAAGAQGMQCLKAFLADQRANLIVDALQTQAAGTSGTGCLADQLGLPHVDANKPMQPALNAHNA